MILKVWLILAVLALSERAIAKKSKGDMTMDWEPWSSSPECECDCEEKMKVIAMEKVVKVPRVRIFDSKEMDQFKFSKATKVARAVKMPSMQIIPDDGWS